MTQAETPSDFKLLETRKRDGYTYRLYRNSLGQTRQTYEIGAPLATDLQVQNFIRSLKRKAAGRKNMVPGPKPGHAFKRGVRADPDRVAAIIEDSGDLSMTIDQICKKHGIATKTYYKIVWEDR